ncbi:hypothetical protein ACOQFL_17370 [Actinopolyspora sp. H202]
MRAYAKWLVVLGVFLILLALLMWWGWNAWQQFEYDMRHPEKRGWLY